METSGETSFQWFRNIIFFMFFINQLNHMECMITSSKIEVFYSFVIFTKINTFCKIFEKIIYNVMMSGTSDSSNQYHVIVAFCMQ